MGNFVSSQDVAGGLAAALFAVQLLTPADPFGKTFRLLRQFRKQVGKVS